MKALTLDFAPRTAAAMARRLPWWAWWLLMVGLTACLLLAWNLWALQRQTAPLQEELEGLQHRLDARSARPRLVKRDPISPGQAVAVNATIRQLNIPWADVLDAVEDASGANVALIELNPDARRQLLRVMAEARSADEMIAYIERLKKQALFTSVRLVKHEINEQDRNQPVRFEFEAPWQEFAR